MFLMITDAIFEFHHKVVIVVEIPLFLGIFALYLLTLDINTTVSTWLVRGNISRAAAVLSS